MAPKSTPDAAADPAPSPVPESAPSPSAPSPSAPLVSVDRLITEAQDFLGVSSHVVAGALSDQTADLTVADARQRVRTWLAQPVKTEGAI